MNKTITGIAYAGLALSNAAFGYFSGIGKEGFHKMDDYDWMLFSLTMMVNLFVIMRALANGTFSNGNGKAPEMLIK